MAREYKIPKMPRVTRATPRALADRLFKPHAEISKRIDVNASAVPSHLATELALAVDDAVKHIEAKRAEMKDALTKREKVWTTPRAPMMEGVFALQAFAQFASTQKDPAKVWTALINKKEPGPFDLSLIRTAIELNLPVMGDATPMLYEQKRRELELPDSVAEEMGRYAEIARDAAHEIAETRSVLLAGVSGASYPALAQLLKIEMSAEEKSALRDEFGSEEVTAHNAFAAMAKAAMVSAEDQQRAAPRFAEQDADPFTFRAAS